MQKTPFCLLLLLPLVFAGISSLSIETTLGQSGYATSKLIASFGETGKTVYFYFWKNYEYITVKDSTGLPVAYDAQRSENYTLVKITVPLDYVEIELWTAQLTKKDGGDWSYLNKLRSSENISGFSAGLYLPPDAKLKNTNGAVSTYKDSLKISWDADAIQAGSTASMGAGYSVSDFQFPVSGFGEPELYVYVAGFAVLLLIIYTIVYYRNTGKLKAEEKKKAAASPTTNEPQTEHKLESNSVFKTLDETDKEIIREIAAQGGKTTQIHLQLYTHVPKATLSRRLASLENRQIIMRSQKGNRNLVTLGETMKG